MVRVSGGVFAKEQQFGWYLTDEKGYTLAVSSFCDRIMKLVMLLNSVSELIEAWDKGVLDQFGTWDEF